jgi:glucosamine--fructose-6-phosphate aminotransferase (isomerizing)
MGVKTLAVVNVIGSSIAREADHVMYTYAGPEIAVATTKAYSAQLIAMYILAMKFGLVKGTVNEGSCADCGAKELEEQIANNSGSADEKPAKKSKKAKKEEKSLIPEENVYFYDNLVTELTALPDKIAKILEDKERIQWFAAKFANAQDIFFIGRGIDYAISLEGSLKCKEISYIHSEAYAAGELKHGTISLIEDGTLVIGVLTQNNLFEKTRSNMVEVKSRGAYLMGLTSYGNYSVEDTADFTAYIPKTAECFAASLAVVPLQLLGYYISVAKGLDVDKPRNLAKSVTVE